MRLWSHLAGWRAAASSAIRIPLLRRAAARPAARPPARPGAPPGVAGEPLVVALGMVKNEQDIIEPFIRHTAARVDYLILLDNDSADATRTIALACAAELGNVAVVDSPAFEHTQAPRMTRLLHHCQAAFRADAILLLDADEFLTGDRRTLLAAVAKVPPGAMGLLPWRTQVVLAEEAAAAASDPPRGLRWRRVAEKPLFHKALLRLDGADAAGLSVVAGNHAVVDAAGRPLPAVTLRDFPLRHVPVRSLRQIRAKAINGWAAITARNPAARTSPEAFQWRDAFDAIVAGRLSTAAELAAFSAGYAMDPGAPRPPPVLDPGEFDYVRRHSDGSFAEELALVGRSWERSLLAPSLPLDHLRDWHPPGASGPLTADVAPFRFLAEVTRPASVLDAGCGAGAALEVFRHCGAAEVLGLDLLARRDTCLDRASYREADLGAPLDLGRRFALVVCTELAQHLPRDRHATLLETLDRHAEGLILFSAAAPGQPGAAAGQRPAGEWIDLWAARGWAPAFGDTCALRCLASLPWLRRNLLLLRRGGAPDPVGVARLRHLAAQPFVWTTPAPGLRQTAFGTPAT